MEFLNNCPISIGQKVMVYKNLNRNCFSIKDPKLGRVIGYAMSVTLRNSIFRVSMAGRNRVLRDRRRNVHAVVVGEFVCVDESIPAAANRVAYYNPYLTETFIDEHTKEPLSKAAIAHCQEKRVYFHS